MMYRAQLHIFQTTKVFQWGILIVLSCTHQVSYVRALGMNYPSSGSLRANCPPSKLRRRFSKAGWYHYNNAETKNKE